METADFIKFCKNECLKLGDIKNMKKGDVLDVVIWDPNYHVNYIWQYKRFLNPTEPTIFYKINRHKITILDHANWLIQFNYGDCSDGEVIEHPIHIVNDNGQDRIRWTELKNDLSKYSDDSCVGWRGYIMLWEKLQNKPLVYIKSVSDFAE